VAWDARTDYVPPGYSVPTISEEAALVMAGLVLVQELVREAAEV